MSEIRDLEREEIKRLYRAAFKQAWAQAEESHEALGKPSGAAFLKHPIYGFGVGVRLEWQGAAEVPLLEGGEVEQIGEGE